MIHQELETENVPVSLTRYADYLGNTVLKGNEGGWPPSQNHGSLHQTYSCMWRKSCYTCYL